MPLHQNQYGANLGGPVLKNKLFFFFCWEHESLSSASPASYVMPTTAELNGDFSADPQVIYDPNTGKPFPGNNIAGRIDPAALKILQLETPNESMVNQTPYVNNTFVSVPAIGVQTQYNARIDATLGKDTVFARYTFWNPHNESGRSFRQQDRRGAYRQLYPGSGSGRQSRVFSDIDCGSALLLSGELQLPGSVEQRLPHVDDQQSMGGDSRAPPDLVFSLPALRFRGIAWGLTFPNCIGTITFGLSTEASPRLWENTALKSGGNWRQVLWEAYPGSGGFGDSRSPVSPQPSTWPGNALASFMLGIPSQTSVTVQPPPMHSCITTDSSSKIPIRLRLI